MRSGEKLSTRVCVAGITGWAGRAVAEGIAASNGLELVSGVSRSAAGQKLTGVLGMEGLSGSIYRTVAEAIEGAPADVLVDFTSAEAVGENVMAAIERGVNVVVGTSGLTADDYALIETRAAERGVGVIAAGNFSMTAALLKKFSLEAAKYMNSWEIIDYAGAGKPDVPSGTARELAEQMGQVRRPSGSLPPDQLLGPQEARGAAVEGTQVHSVRLPSYMVSVEVIFGQPGARLSMRHDAGESAEPYVAGALLAVRRVVGRTGLTRGMDALL